MRAHTRLFALLICALVAGPAAAQVPFVAFESGPVRPLAMAPAGDRLFVVNTPDNRLEIYDIKGYGIVPAFSVKVGMEPVAVGVRNDSEVWVVNHLSDSVSVVDVSATPPRVVRTLLVGDEPRDIVFSANGRAFITTAHRGQHRSHGSISAVTGAGDPQLTTAGIGRADVWVFDPAALGGTIGGTPLEIIELFGDTPRALAVDGNTVYAAAFHSGNQTAVVNEGRVCDGFGGSQCSGDGITSPNGLPAGNLPGGNPGPSTNSALEPAPETSLVVKFDNASGEWRDEGGRNWSNGIRFHLPDHDVFAIDATSLNQTDDFEHVGTILFNMVVNPVNGNVYVSNTDAQNLTRFEGPGVFGSTTVQGNLGQSHVTVITPGTGDVEPRHLNRHIDYSVTPAAAGTKDHSLATPVDMVVSSDGSTLYVAAFGSSKVGVFATADLENDVLWTTPYPGGFDPATESANYVSVSGGGPAGLVLDEARARLYVATRFDNGISIVNTATGTETSHVVFPNPEPAAVSDGRFMLYDANRTSSNGEASCSSCHIFGDFDSLAWDLGNPDDGVSFNPQPINFGGLIGFLGGTGSPLNGTGNVDDFASMKGPMTTQTLRGMVNSGHMHWRGDRANGFFGIDDPHTNDSDLSFRNFIVAFEGLVGLDVDMSVGQGNLSDPNLETDVQSFADFMLSVVLPPNPVRNLDNSLTPDQQVGDDFYFGTRRSDGGAAFLDGILGEQAGFTCEGCHRVDASQGFFGTGGNASFENEVQIFKIPHLRNLYQKVGMFGMPHVDFNNPGDNGHKGDQVRGTGFLHDGSTDTLFRFFQATVFNNGQVTAGVGFNGGDAQRQGMEEFMLAFDTDLAPIVGQQVTLDSSQEADTLARIASMEVRAGTAFTSQVLGGVTTECDLVASAVIAGVARGWLYNPASLNYLPDDVDEPPVAPATLKALANTAGQELTFTCVPPGSGERVARDRDQDGFLNHDEFQAPTSPANPAAFPGACNNGMDDDGDGLTDLADPGCGLSATADIENPECSNGVDDDGDGRIDIDGTPKDLHCAGANDNRERPSPSGSCGLLGIEAVLLLAPLATFRRRRRQR